MSIKTNVKKGLFGLITILTLTSCASQVNTFSNSVAPSQANTTDQTLLTWSNQAAVAAYSYNYKNYRTKLADNAQYYTPYGWRRFMTTVNNRKTVKKIVNENLTVSATTVNSPVVLNQRPIDNVYTWNVKVPLQVTYQSGATQMTQNKNVYLKIIRVPTTVNANGIAISDIKVQ